MRVLAGLVMRHPLEGPLEGEPVDLADQHRGGSPVAGENSGTAG
jgi:hypothetical protein